MSNMIQCDGCKKMMYADCRSDKGDYHEVWIDRSSSFHLCRACYDKFMRKILHMTWDEDEQQYV